MALFRFLRVSMTFLLAAAGLLLALDYRHQNFPILPPEGQLVINFPPSSNTHSELFHPPLRTEGRNIVDSNNKRFKLVSVNWYGASDEKYIPGGLDIRHRSDIAKVIRSLGFNSVRLPYADEIVMENPRPDDLLAANKDLVGKSALEVYEAVVNSLTDAGLAVIINNHITQATWCCGANPCDSAWYNDYLSPACRVSQSEDQWLENWKTVMSPFVNNPRVIGADLRNEVRGLWGTMPWDSWATAAEWAGNELLKMRADWLIFVEGTSSSNDLSGVRTRPVVLNTPGRVVLFGACVRLVRLG